MAPTAVIVVLGASLLLSHCASYTEETAEIRSAYRADQFDKAMERMEKSSLKDEGRNRLLYFLEKAMILDRLGQRDKSRKILLDADTLADKLFTKSISKEALTYIYNESAQDYAGEDYEKVAIHIILALSFIEDRDFDAARVEARKINSMLAYFNSKYDEHKNRYSEDALASYLAGLIHERGGELDDALIDYQKALKLYEGVYAREFEVQAPEQLVVSLCRLYVKRRPDRAGELAKKYPKLCSANINPKIAKAEAGTGEIVIVHETGTIAPKVARDFFLPVGGQIIRISFPTINPRDHREFGNTGVAIEGHGDFREAELFQDESRIGYISLDDRRSRLILKQGARLVAKGVLTEQAYRNFGPVGGIAANVYSAVTETADTRGWTLLPGAFYISRVRLEPGTYTVKPKTVGRIGKIETVELKSGQIVILRDAS